MKKNVADESTAGEPRNVLDEIVRHGAQEMLAKALEDEVDAFLAQHGDNVDEDGRRQVVRNGYLPERELLTGVGPVRVRQPRARDRREVGPDEKIHFSSAILPRYLRRSKSLDELIPWLYLRGISSGDFTGALEALVGPEAKNLSANVVTRLAETWRTEYETWNRRDLSDRTYVYFWADGVHFNIRLEEEKQCILVLMAATADGSKELIGILDGYRESEQSWRELLVDLKARGLKKAPKIAVGDGALGFWAALRKVFPTTREQRCWVHKTANVLNKLPKSVQTKAKKAIHEIWMAETREDAHKAFDLFVEKYKAKFSNAVECLKKDRESLLAFYDFPAEHWIHLRTTNPIESTFATVRLRHRRTKGNGSRSACLAMVFKLSRAAEKRWRRLNSPLLLLKLVEGYTFVDGIVQEKDAA